MGSFLGPNETSKPRLFLFGPQALTFNVEAFNTLRTQLQQKTHHEWALDAIKGLPQHFSSASEAVPKLRYVNGVTTLEDLNKWLCGEEIPTASFPLPNLLLSPLVVIAQLSQYSAFLKAALPDLSETQALPKSVKESTETFGLCTGMLSAFAVGCSTSLAELQRYGAVAVRLAMLIGALVDAEEFLRRFPEAYISVSMDEKRATVTTSKDLGPNMMQQLRLSGIHATEIPLCGRFHWPQHLEDVEQLNSFCQSALPFQFPNISKLVLPIRSNCGGQYVTSGKLHEISLRAILVEQSQWYKSFNIIYQSQLSSKDSAVICFGSERCVPPSIAHRFGSRLIQVSDIELSLSPLPGKLLNQKMDDRLQHLPDERIAVIGMAIQAPGADDLEQFWNILSEGKSQHQEVPTSRFGFETPWRDDDPKRKWYGNFMRDYNTFDHKFFKKSPREMASTDPQQRLAMQIAYQALEQSGYFQSRNINKHIGCYMGLGNVDYEANIACSPANAYSATGNLKSFVAGKISHYFGWTGPSVTFDTACSTSTVAIHTACRAILSGECTTALAGGSNVMTSPDWYHNLAGASFLSPTGQCKPFDIDADGYCRGEAVGAVVLKRFSSAVADGDQIFGVLANTKVYQNENTTAITVPNEPSLSQLFLDATRDARLKPEEVSVVEAHGTGTSVGDPAEFDAIRKVFGGSIRSNNLTVTSVKGLVGHTETASGVTSLIKVLLMMHERSIPPQASFTALNPSLNATPKDKIEIPTGLKPWNSDFRAALINNYGASGSNASLVVTQAPEPLSSSSSKSSPAGKFPFWLSSFDEKSLRTYIGKLRNFLKLHATSKKDLSLSNLSFQISRQSNRILPQALIFDANSHADLDQHLTNFEKDDLLSPVREDPNSRPVVLCFGGQVSTFVGLDHQLFEGITVLRSHLDQCNAMCLSLGLNSIYPDIFQRSPIQDTAGLQLALFATQYSCAKAWLDSGVRPVAVVGHSFGELVALCIAGALSLRDAIRMVSSRAGLIQENWNSEKGSMMAVEGDPADVEILLSRVRKAFSRNEKEISIACFNGPRSFTLAGSFSAIDMALEIAKNDPLFVSIKSKKLNVTHAFHSAFVDSITPDLHELGKNLHFSQPTIRFESAKEQKWTGTLDARFLADHLRQPVYFSHAVQRLNNDFPSAIWLEAGSNSTVTAMASRALGSPLSSHFQAINLTSDGSFDFLVDATTRLWKEGLNVTFWPHHSLQTCVYQTILLPPYQFEKSKHWMDIKKPQNLEAQGKVQPEPLEPPTGLTTFIGYQDEANRKPKFQVNTGTEKYIRLMSGHIMADAAIVCPGMFQLEIVIDALTKLRPEFQDLSFQPQLQGMDHHNPLPLDESKRVWLEAECGDDEGLDWDWKLMASAIAGSSSILHTTGTVVFRSANDPQVASDFERVQRLAGRKRGLRLLHSDDQEEVLQGRNIYRAFSPVIDYKEIYRHVKKLVGGDDESAGRVIKSRNKEGFLDSVLADCFCQCAGIYINLMTDKAELYDRGIFVCTAIDRWIRSTKADADGAKQKIWDVFAVHQQLSDKRYVSDVFAFNSSDGSLVEAILGINYSRVSFDQIRRILGSPIPSVPTPSTTSLSRTPTNFQNPGPLMLAPLPILPKPKTRKMKIPKTAGKVQKTTKPDVSGKSRGIICNLSGLEPHEVKDSSDLVELGIDSLMNTSKPFLGLEPGIYKSLVNTVTHIVHNAWPMSITRSVHAYETQFQVMRNLIDLAKESITTTNTYQRAAVPPFRFGFQFISSIGVVGHRPLWSSEALAPEERMSAASALPVGYADAKLVCERMLDETLQRYNRDRFRPMAVRIGQITGSVTSGYWNPSEFLASLIKSSQGLNALPDLEGTLSWYPVNAVAATLGELLMSDSTPHPIYHIENPKRQPWREMIGLLSSELGVPRENTISFEQWTERVGQWKGPAAENPAGHLDDFYKEHFVRMSCGDMVLDTNKCREHSETLRGAKALDSDLVRKYIDTWKKVGFLR